MKKKILVISDPHYHNWSAFAFVDSSGVNSRLMAQLDETMRQVLLHRKEIAGVVFAGDIFHVRGKLAPSVLNPVKTMFDHIKALGLQVEVIAGNHDLEHKHSNDLGSAVTALENSAVIYNAPVAKASRIDPLLGLLPWIENTEELKKQIEAAAPVFERLIVHAPINGVIPGLPPNGLDPLWIAGLGFKSFLAGHYHHHKHFGSNVYSIGSLGHCSWSDVGSTAGVMLVDLEDDSAHFSASRLPRFIDLTAEMTEGEMELESDGNYVRLKVDGMTHPEQEKVRTFLMNAGAKGVTIINVPKQTTVRRDGTVVSAKLDSLQDSAANYVAGLKLDDDAKLRVNEVVAKALTKAIEISEE